MFSEQNLPSLDSASIVHSDLVYDEIARVIENEGGSIRFDTYMALALYAPGLGYYVAGTQKFGASGDFVTAPELGKLFGAMVARQCSAVFEEIEQAEMLEIGGGSGALALSILEELAELGRLPEKYTILELSPELRDRQRRLFEEHIPQLLPRIEWRSNLPEREINGCVIANEILDALPVRRFEFENGQLYEYWVVLADDRSFAWQRKIAQESEMAAIFARPGFEYCRQVARYKLEICAAQEFWLNDIAKFLGRGAALLFDYGSGRKERFGPAYPDGSLRCFLRHRVHDNPLVYPGLQDITASVDFTAVAEAAVKAGFAVRGFSDQASFLMSCGILHKVSELQTNANEFDVLKLNEQLKSLLLPTKMGTAFKSMCLTKNYDQPLIGYSVRDDRRAL